MPFCKMLYTEKAAVNPRTIDVLEKDKVYEVNDQLLADLKSMKAATEINEKEYLAAKETQDIAEAKKLETQVKEPPENKEKKKK